MKRLVMAGLLLVSCTPSPATPGNPAQTKAPAAATAGVSFAMTGNQTTQPFTLAAGRRTFAYTHDGTGAFVVKLKSPDGKVEETVAWTAGKADSTMTYDAPAQGQYFLVVEASGNWTVKAD